MPYEIRVAVVESALTDREEAVRRSNAVAEAVYEALCDKGLYADDTVIGAYPVVHYNEAEYLGE